VAAQTATADHGEEAALDRATAAVPVVEVHGGQLLSRASRLMAALEELPAVRVPIVSLVVGDSPRRAGADLGHIRMLAALPGHLPPILVNRSTMQVIDGMHRLRAAQLRGEQEIEARFFEGDVAGAFVLAVQANVRHGWPLCMADRKAAADRIIGLYPAWSDRAIAEIAGVSASTVGARRRRLGVQTGQLDAKVGRDGRVRPVDPAERKAIAERLLADKPGISLREAARQARLSPETVRRLRIGIDAAGEATPAEPSAAESSLEASPPRRPVVTAANPEGASPMRALVADPAFRSTDSGRALLRLLSATAAVVDLGGEVIDAAPPHCLDWLALSAQACVGRWQAFAEQLDRKRAQDANDRIRVK
jgi:hypothetical protein